MQPLLVGLPCAPLCIPTHEIEEEAKESGEDSGHPELVMEYVSAQFDRGKLVASKDQQQAQDSEPK